MIKVKDYLKRDQVVPIKLTKKEYKSLLSGMKKAGEVYPTRFARDLILTSLKKEKK